MYDINGDADDDSNSLPVLIINLLAAGTLSAVHSNVDLVDCPTFHEFSRCSFSASVGFKAPCLLLVD